MKILKGSVVERRFAVPENGNGKGKGEMRETVRKVYERGKVAYMCDEMGLHEISNPSPVEYAVSLHREAPISLLLELALSVERESRTMRLS
jgi:cysteine dioxygenase